jgi:hypothetical protein
MDELGFDDRGPRMMKNMDFSDALLRIKEGMAVSRPGLDGFISMTPAATIPPEKIWSPQNRRVAEDLLQRTGQWMRVAPSITRCQPNGEGVIVMGWQPTQEDLFAEDWGMCV